MMIDHRIQTLLQQCTFWPGTVVSALYLPVHRGIVQLGYSAVDFAEELWEPSNHALSNVLQMIKAHLDSAHQSFKDTGDPFCNLHVKVFIEEVPEWEKDPDHGGSIRLPYPDDTWGYPVNALRNQAMHMVNTEVCHVFNCAMSHALQQIMLLKTGRIAA